MPVPQPKCDCDGCFWGAACHRAGSSPPPPAPAADRIQPPACACGRPKSAGASRCQDCANAHTRSSVARRCLGCGVITAPAYMPEPPDGLCIPCRIRKTGAIPAGYALSSSADVVC